MTSCDPLGWNPASNSEAGGDDLEGEGTGDDASELSNPLLNLTSCLAPTSSPKSHSINILGEIGVEVYRFIGGMTCKPCTCGKSHQPKVCDCGDSEKRAHIPMFVDRLY